jgi:hypothetical protein
LGITAQFTGAQYLYEIIQYLMCLYRHEGSLFFFFFFFVEAPVWNIFFKILLVKRHIKILTIIFFIYLNNINKSAITASSRGDDNSAIGGHHYARSVQFSANPGDFKIFTRVPLNDI